MILGCPCIVCGKRIFFWSFFNCKCYKCWKKRRDMIIQSTKEAGEEW